MMKPKTRWTTAILFLLTLMLSACVPVAMPPIVIAPAPPPVAATDPKPEPKPRATLAVILTSCTTREAIAHQWVTVRSVDDPSKQEDDGTNVDGYIAFDAIEQGIYDIISGDHSGGRYETFTQRVRLKENQNFPICLKPIGAPEPPPAPQPPVVEPTPVPPPVVTPAPPTYVIACDVRNNVGRVSRECLAAVAERSVYYRPCEVTGSTEACHYYVREVVRALVAAQNDPRWGLLRKTKGGDQVEGYGTDVIAYLPHVFAVDGPPTWRWQGVDVIGGIGEPHAHFNAGELTSFPPLNCDDWKEGMGWCNRTSDVWAPVP
jgi:hypothetical protein